MGPMNKTRPAKAQHICHGHNGPVNGSRIGDDHYQIKVVLLGRSTDRSHITEGKIDFLIFFLDPLEPQPHDPDVKASSGLPWFGTFRLPAIERLPIS